MYILGINAYYIYFCGGASACLIRNSQLVAAVAEERFRRSNVQAGFPVGTIRFVRAAAW